MIASEIPNTTFIFFNSPSPILAEKLKHRWEANNLALIHKSIFLDPVPVDKHIRIIELMDFILDPLHFGSGTVFNHAMAVGTPIVTMPQKQMKSRVVAGGYKQMGIQKPPIAKNINDYIDLCKELSSDKALRDTLREELKEMAKIKLFDNNEVLEEWSHFIKAAVESNRNGQLLPPTWNSSN